jgi:hypothetical protein
MKQRAGFVSNSSSSSFIVQKHVLTEEQIQEILRPATPEEDPYDSWASWFVEETADTITGYTSMDNYQYTDRFKAMGITHLVKNDY